MNFDVVAPGRLRAYLQQHDCMLLDVRTKEEYDKGHWTGAKSFPYEEGGRWERTLPGNRVLVFYCAHGANSMQLARRLGMQGYRTATVVGGYEAMKKELRE